MIRNRTADRPSGRAAAPCPKLRWLMTPCAAEIRVVDLGDADLHRGEERRRHPGDPVAVLECDERGQRQGRSRRTARSPARNRLAPAAAGRSRPPPARRPTLVNSTPVSAPELPPDLAGHRQVDDHRVLRRPDVGKRQRANQHVARRRLIVERDLLAVDRMRGAAVVAAWSCSPAVRATGQQSLEPVAADPVGHRGRRRRRAPTSRRPPAAARPAAVVVGPPAAAPAARCTRGALRRSRSRRPRTRASPPSRAARRCLDVRPPARWISSAVVLAIDSARSAIARSRACTRYELKFEEQQQRPEQRRTRPAGWPE